MATTNQELANVLDDLIEINNDRIEGYEKAIKETDDPDLKALFIDMASRSHQFKNELSAEVPRRDADRRNEELGEDLQALDGY